MIYSTELTIAVGILFVLVGTIKTNRPSEIPISIPNETLYRLRPITIDPVVFTYIGIILLISAILRLAVPQ